MAGRACHTNIDYVQEGFANPSAVKLGPPISYVSRPLGPKGCSCDNIRGCYNGSRTPLTDIFADYNIIRRFGGGKSGAVPAMAEANKEIKGKDGCVLLKKGDKVLLKTYTFNPETPNDPEASRPFREMTYLCKLSGTPGFPIVFQWGFYGVNETGTLPHPQPFIVTSLIDGIELAKANLGAMSCIALKTISLQLLYLFARADAVLDGFIHNDLHPGNIFLLGKPPTPVRFQITMNDSTYDLNGPLVNIIDFDISRSPQFPKSPISRTGNFLPEATLKLLHKWLGVAGAVLVENFTRSIINPDIRNWAAYFVIMASLCQAKAENTQCSLVGKVYQKPSSQCVKSAIAIARTNMNLTCDSILDCLASPFFNDLKVNPKTLERFDLKLARPIQAGIIKNTSPDKLQTDERKVGSVIDSTGGSALLSLILPTELAGKIDSNQSKLSIAADRQLSPSEILNEIQLPLQGMATTSASAINFPGGGFGVVSLNTEKDFKFVIQFRDAENLKILGNEGLSVQLRCGSIAPLLSSIAEAGNLSTLLGAAPIETQNELVSMIIPKLKENAANSPQIAAALPLFSFLLEGEGGQSQAEIGELVSIMLTPLNAKLGPKYGGVLRGVVTPLFSFAFHKRISLVKLLPAIIRPAVKEALPAYSEPLLSFFQRVIQFFSQPESKRNVVTLAAASLVQELLFILKEEGHLSSSSSELARETAKLLGALYRIVLVNDTKQRKSVISALKTYVKNLPEEMRLKVGDIASTIADWAESEDRSDVAKQLRVLKPKVKALVEIVLERIASAFPSHVQDALGDLIMSILDVATQNGLSTTTTITKRLRKLNLPDIILKLFQPQLQEMSKPYRSMVNNFVRQLFGAIVNQDFSLKRVDIMIKTIVSPILDSLDENMKTVIFTKLPEIYVVLLLATRNDLTPTRLIDLVISVSQAWSETPSKSFKLWLSKKVLILFANVVKWGSSSKIKAPKAPKKVKEAITNASPSFFNAVVEGLDKWVQGSDTKTLISPIGIYLSRALLGDSGLSLGTWGSYLLNLILGGDKERRIGYVVDDETKAREAAILLEDKSRFEREEAEYEIENKAYLLQKFEFEHGYSEFKLQRRKSDIRERELEASKEIEAELSKPIISARKRRSRKKNRKVEVEVDDDDNDVLSSEFLHINPETGLYEYNDPTEWTLVGKDGKIIPPQPIDDTVVFEGLGRKRAFLAVGKIVEAIIPILGMTASISFDYLHIEGPTLSLRLILKLTLPGEETKRINLPIETRLDGPAGAPPPLRLLRDVAYLVNELVITAMKKISSVQFSSLQVNPKTGEPTTPENSVTSLVSAEEFLKLSTSTLAFNIYDAVDQLTSLKQSLSNKSTLRATAIETAEIVQKKVSEELGDEAGRIAFEAAEIQIEKSLDAFIEKLTKSANLIDTGAAVLDTATGGVSAVEKVGEFTKMATDASNKLAAQQSVIQNLKQAIKQARK